MPKYPFDKITIDGFRGLKQLELQDLGLINVLVGENNSGKTSVLEALSILCNPLEPLEWLAMVRRRDFGGLDETRIQSLRWCFMQSGQLVDPDLMFQSGCQMTCEGTFPLRALQVIYKDIVGIPSRHELRRLTLSARLRDRDEDIEDTKLWRGGEISHLVHGIAQVNKGTLFENDELDKEELTVRVWEDVQPYSVRPRQAGGYIPTETMTPYSYQINRVQVRHQSLQVFEDHQDLILELIRDFDPDVDNLKIASFRGGRPAIYVNHRILGPAPLSVFGDALRRAVLLASTLPVLRDGGLLLIDEVETGIHVSTLKNCFSWLTKASRQLRVQVIATTHSLEAVDAIVLSSPDNMGDVVSFHLEQTQEKTRSKRIGGDLLLRLRVERGLDVR